jgi:hypothetical protein
VVFFFLFINNTIAFAMLWASILRLAKAAQISSTLWVLCMTGIAWTAWDSGNVFNTDTVSADFKTFITLWPIWGFYRGLSEYQEFATKAARLGTNGLQWADISEDPLCGMKTVLIAMGMEWPLFLLLSFYLDQVFRICSDLSIVNTVFMQHRFDVVCGRSWIMATEYQSTRFFS